METHFGIKGMHCASCAFIIENKLTKVEGVKKAEVNFARETAKIEYDPATVSAEKMNATIAPLGYTLASRDTHTNHDAQTAHDMKDMAGMPDMPGMDHSAHLGLGMTKDEKEKELQEQKVKTSVALPIALLTFALMLWQIMARAFSTVPGVPVSMEALNAVGLVIASVILFWIGKPFLAGVKMFAQYRVANMDSLIGIGTLTAYLYSAIVVLFPQAAEAMRLPSETYFDVVIVVIGFVVFGKYLEARSKQRTNAAIEKLLGLQAKTALVVREGKEIEIPLSEVVIDDIVIVKPGTKIPVDGIITEGKTSVDESMITGESMPADKVPGDVVIGATMNKQGSIQLRATKVGSDTMLAQIIKLVEEASGSRAPIQNVADKISAIFVPTVLVIAILSAFVWLTVGSAILGSSAALSYAILSFVGVLVIACPCALGLATPTAIIVGVGKGAEHGILIKNAESLEILHTVDTVVMDKTGTITEGKPKVTDFVLLNSEMKESEVIAIAGAIENLSEHPIARAITDYARAHGELAKDVAEFSALEGVGVQAEVSGKKVIIRKPNASDGNENEKEKSNSLKKMQSEGKTVVVVEVSGEKVALIAVADTVKENARDAVALLHARGVKVIMLTGDHTEAAEYIAKLAGIDEVIANILPSEKAEKVKALQASGKKVAMVGDGINDAPALAQADVGIAMATGTDIAIESAGITLLHGDIHKIAQAFELSRATIRTVKQNLFWAFAYNVIGIPVAAGLLYPIWGIVLNPAFAGMAMAGSSVSVVTNSLRLKTKQLK